MNNSAAITYHAGVEGHHHEEAIEDHQDNY
jgi:hypothetical protein